MSCLRVRSGLFVWAGLALVALSPLSIAGAQSGDEKGEQFHRPKAEPTSKPSGSAKSGKKEHLKPFPIGPQEAHFKQSLSSVACGTGLLTGHPAEAPPPRSGETGIQGDSSLGRAPKG